MGPSGPVAMRGHEAAVRLPHLVADSDSTSKIVQRGSSALIHLLEAHDCARELNRSQWDFAIEIASLRHGGLSDSALRWLVCKGYVEHARETTLPGEETRHFRKAVGLTFHRRTCFVLSAEGATFVRTSTEHITPTPCAAVLEKAKGSVLPDSQRPTWDSARQRLSFASQIVKEFKVPAANQEMIIASFDEEGWPPRIDDPLPPQVDQDPKRRLHDTINSLNRNQKSALIRFLGDGTGQGVRWEIVQREVPAAKREDVLLEALPAPGVSAVAVPHRNGSARVGSNGH